MNQKSQDQPQDNALNSNVLTSRGSTVNMILTWLHRNY